MRKQNGKESPSADTLFSRALLPSVLCIVLCIIFLSGTTLAWLTDSVESEGTVLVGGYFSVAVEIQNTDTAVTYALTDNRVSLPAGNYSVNVTSDGTAQNGYAAISVGTDSDVETYRLETLPDTFTLTVSGGTVTFGVLPVLGSYTGTDMPLVEGSISYTVSE